MRSRVQIASLRCAFALALCLACGAASAQSVCKYIDAAGNIVFSNLPPEKGYRKISCVGGEETPRKPSNAGKSAPTPAGFPKVDAETQRTRDEMRKKVLGDELAAEEKLLAEARREYNNGAPTPLPEEQSNAAKYQERIARLRQQVQLHERNIDALKKELATTR